MKKKDTGNFPEWLKEQRRRFDLTQEDFSLLFRIPIGTLRAWERGVQSPPEYYKFLLKATIHIYNDPGLDATSLKNILYS